MLFCTTEATVSRLLCLQSVFLRGDVLTKHFWRPVSCPEPLHRGDGVAGCCQSKPEEEEWEPL